MSRAVNRLGWDNNLTPTQIVNLGIPFEQIYIPANLMTPQTSTKETFLFPIGGENIPMVVIAHAPNVENQSFIYITDFESNIDWSDPQFRLRVDWFQAVTEPGKFVEWEVSITIFQNGDDLNATDFGRTEFSFLSPVKPAHQLNGGDAVGDENTILIPTLNGTVPTTNKKNMMRIMFERHGDKPGDTLLQTAYIPGIALQYKTAFENINQWS